MINVIGVCSLCGGRVLLPTLYHSVVPPRATCESCGAVDDWKKPVIPMKKISEEEKWKTMNHDPHEGMPTSINGKKLLNG